MGMSREEAARVIDHPNYAPYRKAMDAYIKGATISLGCQFGSITYSPDLNFNGSDPKAYLADRMDPAEWLAEYERKENEKEWVL